MSRINKRNIPDASDLPPQSKAAWRELVNTVEDLRNAVNGASTDLGILSRNQAGALRAVQETNTIVDSQAQTVANIVETVQPAVPVDRPSTPTLTSGTGTITVKWDGNLLEIPATDNGEGNNPTYGTPIPYPSADSTAFRHVLIQTSPTGNPDVQSGNDEYVSDWVSTGTTLNAAGSATIQVTPGTTVYVRLVAYSYSGTPSGPSGVAVITSVGITMPDLAVDVDTAIANANTNASAAVDAATDALTIAGGAVKSVITEYAVNASESTAPTSGWSTSQPARTPGTFVWVRYVTTFGNDTTSTSSPALMTGNTGASGTNGRGIASTAVTYQLSSSGTTVPSGTWVSSPPAQTNALPFLWTRTVITYSDSTTTTGYSVSLKGSDGSPGSNGVGVSGTAVTYQTSASGTVVPTGTWVTSVPTVTPGQFLWTRTITTYTDSTTSTGYSVSRYGTDGAPGSNGVGISGSATAYQVSSSGTTVPTGTWVASPPSTTSGQYLWTRTTLTFSDGGTQVSYSISRHGTTGSTGTSVSSVTPYYQLVTTGTAAPALPTTNPPPSPWQGTEPAYVSNTELYRSDRIVFSNSTFAYTAVTKVSSYTAATQAVTVANLAQDSANGKIKASQSDPGHDVGRIWFQTDSAGNTVGIKISNGSAWTSYALMADQLIVPSSIGPTLIADGVITTAKLVVGDFTNLIEDDDFDAPLGLTWRRNDTAASSAVTQPVTTGLPGKSWKMDGVSAAVRVEMVNPFAVQPGQQYRFYARAQNQLTGTSPAAYFRIDWFKTDKTASSVTATSSYTVPVMPWGDVTTTFTAPSDAAYGRLFAIHGNNNTGGSWWWGRPQLLRMNTGELIVDGSITTPKIATNAVVARNVFIGDFTNMASGSDFESADLVPWLLVDSGWARSNTTAHSGAWSLRGTVGGTNSIALSTRIDVNEGEEYYFEFWARRDTAYNGTGSNSKLRIGNQTGTYLAQVLYSTAQLPTPNVWVKLSGSYTVPSGVTSLSITLAKDNTAGNIYLDDIIIRRKTDGNLIVDGAIDGKLITGATIRTAASGQRLQLDSFGLRSFDASGNTTSTLFAGTGGLRLTGNLFFGATENEAQLNSDLLRLAVNPSVSTSIYSMSEPSGASRGLWLASVDGPSKGQARIDLYTALATDSEDSRVTVQGAKLQVLDRIEQATGYAPNEFANTKIISFGSIPNNLNAAANPVPFQVGHQNTNNILFGLGSGTSGEIQSVLDGAAGLVGTLHLNPKGGNVLIGSAGDKVVGDSGWTNVTVYGSGWTSGTGSEQIRVRRIGSRVDLVGRINRGSGSAALSNMFTIPVGFRTGLSSGNTPVGFAMETGNAIMLYYNNAANTIFISTGWTTTGTVSATAGINLICSWYVD